MCRESFYCIFVYACVFNLHGSCITFSFSIPVFSDSRTGGRYREVETKQMICMCVKSFSSLHTQNNMQANLTYFHFHVIKKSRIFFVFE